MQKRMSNSPLLHHVNEEIELNIKKSSLRYFRVCFELLFCISLVALNVCGWGFASVAKAAEIYYGVHINLINLMTMSGFSISCFAYLLGMYVVDKYPVIYSLFIAVFLGLLGGWLKYFAGTSFWFCFAGQMISALACPFVNSAPAAVGKEFFEPSNRAIVTALGTLSQLVGMGLGLAILPLYKDRLDEWLFSQAIIISFIMIMTFFLLVVYIVFKSEHGLEYEEPAHPDDDDDLVHQASYKKSLGLLIRNKNFLRLLVGFSIVVGTVNALLSLCDQVGPKSILEHHAGGTLGGLFFGAGAFGAIIVSVKLDRARNYLQVIHYISMLLIPLYLATFSCWEYDCLKGIPIYVGISLMGFLGIPLFPLSIELGIEVSYVPKLHQEGIINGIIQNSQNIVGVFITALSTPHLVFPKLVAEDVPFIWGGFMFVGLYMMATVKPDYRRLERENSRMQTLSGSV